ncbi:MAG: CO dehydrogenase/CO-methylating acetyl-CoA synthase complex subunit beta, partial [Candidatus Omnitrophota bacterium]|nr:CO dehydrogenase/CO-methylating acetyl-CoA synthase complex subunit beta [Candidatus Omnitrophota bacterium]
MSKIVATSAIRGAQAIYREAEEFLNKALKEKGPQQKIGFPETAFYLPMANALLGARVETLKDAQPILAHAKSLLPQIPSDKVWLPYLGDALNAGMSALFSEEIIMVLRYLYGQEPQKDCNGFFSDTILRSLGIQLVDGRMSGFAAVLGAAPDNKTAVQIIRELQGRNILAFVGSSVNGRSIVDQLLEENVQMGWDNYIVPYGRDTIAGIYPLNWAIRAALTFGGVKAGQAEKCLLYTKERVFAFGLVLGELDDIKYATGAGAISMGFPIIADTDIPEIKPSGITTYEALVKELDYKKLVPRCMEVRGIKVKLSSIPIPVPYAAAFEGERVRKEQLHAEFGGKASAAFEYLTMKKAEEVEDGKIELIGPDIDQLEQDKKSLPLAIIVEVTGRKMQKDFEPILERQIHRFTNYAMGIMHVGQREMNWIRISRDTFNKGFRLKHLGIILHAMLHQEYSAIVDKAQVKIYTRQAEVEKLLPQAKRSYDERDERLRG